MGIVWLAVVLASGPALAADPPASAIGHQWQSGYCLKGSAVEAIVCNASTQGAVSADSCSWDGWYLWCTARFPSGAPYGNVPAWPISSCTSGYTWQQVDGTCKSPPLPTPVQACAVSHPVIPGTGVKILIERGDGGSAELPITFAYRSQGVFGSAGGAGQWTLNWLRSLDTSLVGYAPPQVTALRDDGAGFAFGKSTSGWTASGSRDSLQPVTDATGKISAWQYSDSSTNAVETYDGGGKLQSVRERNGRTTTLAYNDQNQLSKVTAPSGRSLTFAYDAQGRVSSITAPDGAVTQYAYNANGMLTTVTWPDNTTRQYVYEDTRFPTALTGVIDEAGVRYATYAYDDQGRAITSELTAGADRYQFQYQPNGQTTVLTPDGGSSVYSFLKQNGVLLPTGVSAPCPTCGSTSQSTDYDPSGNATRRVGYDGSATTYTYDAQGRETQRVEAAGTPNARTITTEWHPTWRLPTKVASPGRIDGFTYDDKGQLKGYAWFPTSDVDGSKGMGAVRNGSITSSGWTYNDAGLVIAAVEMLDDTVTGSWEFTYSDQGNLLTLTNAAGKVGKALQYDGAGRLLEAVNTDGQHIRYQYNARGNLVSSERDGQIVTYEYNPVGFLTAVKGPGTAYLGYEYDATHRLVATLQPQDTAALTDASPFGTTAVGGGADAQSQDLWTQLWTWLKAWLGSWISEAHAQAILIRIPLPTPAPGQSQARAINSGDPADSLEQGTGARRDPVSALLSSLIRGAGNIWDSIRSAVSSSADEDCDREQECEEGRNEDEALCATAKARYGPRGEGVCMTSAAKRYYECRRVGRANITIPLHGIETPL